MRTTTKLVIVNSLVTLLVVLSFAWFSLDRYYAGILREEHKDLERCIQTFWELLEHRGSGFRIQDGRLMVGDHVLNGNYEMPDKIQKIFGGVATIFMGDVRVATNVLNERGERAFGTRLVGPAHEAIFKKGIPYRGEAPILGQIYLTAYDPILDRNGDIIGALFVGVKKSSINRDFNRMKTPMISMLIPLLASFVFVSWLLLRTTRKYELAEAQNLNFLKTLMDTIPTPIFYKDRTGRYLGCNTAYESYLGVRRDEFIGQTAADLWPPDLAEQYRRQDQALFDRPGTQEYEGSVAWSDGTRHDVIFHRATFHSLDGEVAGLVGLVFDITERKAAEAERARFQAEQHHSRMMENFMIQLGHDLRTPLTPLFVLLPLLREKSGNPELARMIDICTRSTEAIQSLTQKALKLVKLSAATGIRFEPVDLAGAVDLSIRETISRPEAGEIACHNRIAPGLVVDSNPELLDELFGNLLSNAVRYTPEGGEINIEAVVSGGSLTVSVRDNGDGMEPELVMHIFDEFFKGDESRHDLASSGLGLSICKRIIDNHHGSIWAESLGKGHGMTVSFTLPLHLPPDRIS